MIFLFCYYIPHQKLVRDEQRRTSQLSSNKNSKPRGLSITNPSVDDISTVDDIIDEGYSLTSNISLTLNAINELKKNSTINNNINIPTTIAVDANTPTSIANEDISVSIQITKWADTEKQQLQNNNSISSESTAVNDQPPNPLPIQKSLLRIPSLVLEEIADDVSNKTQKNRDKDINEAINDLNKKGNNPTFHHRANSSTSEWHLTKQHRSTSFQRQINDEDSYSFILLSLPVLNFRILLFSAIVCSLIFISTTTVITAIVNISDNVLTHFNCSVQTSITVFLVIQRILLYTFFIQRLSYSFKDSAAYKIPNWKLILCAILMCSSSLAPAITAEYFAEAEECNVIKLKYCLVGYVTQDIFWAIFTLFWYIYKLVELENSLTVAKDELSSPVETNTSESTVTMHMSDTSGSVFESPDCETKQSLPKGTDMKRNDSNISQTSSIREKRNSIKLLLRSSISKLQFKNGPIFVSLQKNQKIKRLVKKLLILTCVSITSTILVAVSLFWMPIWSSFSVDLVINNACMLLSFRYADNIFRKLCPCSSFH